VVSGSITTISYNIRCFRCLGTCPLDILLRVLWTNVRHFVCIAMQIGLSVVKHMKLTMYLVAYSNHIYTSLYDGLLLILYL
jgi:hypothetical protein